MLKNHYGVTVDSQKPITGVLNINSAEWLSDDIFGGIDTCFEEHEKECPNENHDNCYFADTTEGYLIGYKKDEDGEYEIDKEAEYSAIVGEIEIQITHSKYVSRCALCSPCYPGQGDLDTLGDFLAYTLPPDVFGDFDHLPIMKIKKGREDYEVRCMIERDRTGIWVNDKTTGKTVWEVWDDEALSLIDAGYFEYKNLEETVLDYLIERKIIDLDEDRKDLVL